MIGLTPRITAVISLVFAHSGLTRLEFDCLPVFGARPQRKTVDTYAKSWASNRYSGAALRKIRAEGQHAECARRRARMGALAAA